MKMWLVAFQATPLNYTSRRTMVVEAETPRDAQAIVRDALLRAGDGEGYLGLGEDRWCVEDTDTDSTTSKPKPYNQQSYRATHSLGVFPYVPPPPGRVLNWG